MKYGIAMDRRRGGMSRSHKRQALAATKSEPAMQSFCTQFSMRFCIRFLFIYPFFPFSVA